MSVYHQVTTGMKAERFFAQLSNDEQEACCSLRLWGREGKVDTKGLTLRP